jgi:Restriction endonuclease S subunits
VTNRVVKMGEICELRRDFVSPGDVQLARYVALEHLDSGRTNIRNWEDSPKVRSTKSRFEAGDVLYGKLRPYLRKAGLAEWPGVCSTEVLVLCARSGRCDPGFLAFLLQSKDFVAHAISHTSGVNHPRVSWMSIEDFEFEAPPLLEQREIARTLSKIQEAIDVQTRILATLRELKSGSMAKLFRHRNWLEVTLAEVAKVGNGSTPNRNEPRYWIGGSIPWLTSGKVHEGIIEFADEFVTEVARTECHLPFVPASSVVVAITGQGKTLGNAAIVKFETCVNQHLAYITVNSDRLLPEFLLAVLQSRYDDSRSWSGGRHDKGRSDLRLPEGCADSCSLSG